MQSILSAYCAAKQTDALWRKKPMVQQEAGCLDFQSNDYLKLAKNPILVSAYQEGFARFGASSSASPMLSGYQEAHEALESQFCSVFQMQDALLFSSGFAANLAIGRMLSAFSAYVVLDKASHASIYDGLDPHKALMQRFISNDELVLLGAQTKNTMQQPPVLWLEGIYSMSGRSPNLTKLTQVFPESMYIVDEAHSFGILGKQGLGFCEQERIPNEQILFRVIPFGKAMAGQGAIVLGSHDAIGTLRQFARSYIYSTAISAAHAFGLSCALKLVLSAHAQRQRLQALQHTIQDHSGGLNAQSPIVRVYCSHIDFAIELQSFLKNRKILVSLVRPPTVSMKELGLRMVLNAGHTEFDVLFLLNALSEYADVAYAN